MDGIGHALVVRATMAFHHNAVEAEEGRADGPYGGYQAIMVNPHGGYVGASESRKDGQAAGY